MRLYLVQHGQSKPKEEDPERGLTPKGTADVQRVAAFIKPIGLTVSVIWHSGKARAVQTAEILAEAVSSGRGVMHRDGLDPLEAVQPVARDIDEMTEDLMIVGHLPFLGNLASYLIGGEDSAELVAFQQGGVVCLEKADKAGWKVRWMVTPDMLTA